MSFASPPQTGSDAGWRPPTTMVDVLFLILAFFITIVSFQDDDRQVNVALPEQESGAGAAAVRTQIVVTVTRDEKIYMGDRLFSPDQLRGTLADLAKQYPNESVIVRADRDSSMGMFARVVDMANAAGLRNVTFGVIKPKSEAGQ